MNLSASMRGFGEPSVATRSGEGVGRGPGSTAPPRLDPWLALSRGEPQLVQRAEQFEALVDSAGGWAENITLCLTAPRAGSAALVGADQLMRWSVKAPRIYLRHPDATDAALVRRFAEAATTWWVGVGGKQVASQLLVFVRGRQARVLLSHLPLERAASGAAFGTLLGFCGEVDTEFVRACRAQIDSWASRGEVPLGSEVDALLASRRAEDSRRWQAIAHWLAEVGGLSTHRVLCEPVGLLEGLGRFVESIVESTGAPEPSAWVEASVAYSAPIGAGWTVHLRSAPEGYRLRLEHRKGRAFTLSLCSGEAWAAGDCLLLVGENGELQLVWRGGLLGHSPWRQQSLWEQTVLPLAVLPARGLDAEVAVVSIATEPLAPQLVGFAEELSRLASEFAADAPPLLGHALADFEQLSSQQQAHLAWSALFGFGQLPMGDATVRVARSLRDQGSVKFEGSSPPPQVLESIEQVLVAEADRSLRFDSEQPGHVRAIQPDLRAYVEDDWVHCALRALPASGSVALRVAIRLTFQFAETHLGLFGWTLREGSVLEAGIESALLGAVQRGLLVRVGVGSLRRPHRDFSESQPGFEMAAPTAACAAGFDRAWTHALGQLSPLQRLVLTSREGWGGPVESREHLAERIAMRPDHVEQLEIQAWAVLEQREELSAYLVKRLSKALSAVRFVPLVQLLAEDPWWRGAEAHLAALPKIFERLLGCRYHLVRLPGPGEEVDRLAVARFSKMDLEGVLASLREGAGTAEQLAKRLDPAMEEYLVAGAESVGDPEATAVDEATAKPFSALSEARLRLQDALRSVFRVSQAPLAFDKLLAGARQRIEVDEALLREVLCAPPFVQLDEQTYGLLSRDVPGGQEGIARTVLAAAEQIRGGRRALGAEHVVALAKQFYSSEYSAPLVLCLLRSDPSLHVSAAGQVTLSSWQNISLAEAPHALRLAIPATTRERFEQLARADSPELEDCLERADYQLRRLEQEVANDSSLPLAEARDMVEGFGRLATSLQPSAGELNEREVAIGTRMARAAVGLFADNATDEDEDDLERGPSLRPEQLRQCRAVLLAVQWFLGLEPRGGAAA